ncbi:hypothetical protein BDR22DRAFT_9593 [Usnea florida]
MLSHILIFIMSISFASAQLPLNETFDCQLLNSSLEIYRHPNASNSYSIPAVVSTGSTITNSTAKSWQIINSMSQIPYPFNVSDPPPQQLSQNIFLDTSSTINGSSLSSPLPFAGCSLVFSTYTGKTSSDGSCGNVFGQSCVDEIILLAEKTARAAMPAVGLPGLCDDVTRAVNDWIKTSSKSCSKDPPTVGITHSKLCPRPYVHAHMADSWPRYQLLP